MEMEYLRWILLGTAIILVVAVYFFSRARSKKDQYQTPLDAANDVPSFNAVKEVENQWMHGVGPVRVVSDDAEESTSILTQDEVKFSAAESDDIKISAEKEIISEAKNISKPNSQEPVEPVKNKSDDEKRVDNISEDNLHDEQLIKNITEHETPERESVIEQVSSETENTDVAIDDVISVYVLAQPDELIKGEKILSASYALHMDFGAMKIFHRHDQDEERKIQFSMANIKQPGWFEIDNMNDLETPGVSFFMQVSLVDKPSAVLDEMMITAHSLSSMIGATLCGAQRKPLDEAQTNELREKVKRIEKLKSQSV